MGAIKLNPENPLGISHIIFSTFNEVVQGNYGRFFNVTIGNQINCRILYDWLIENRNENLNFILSAQSIENVKNEVEPYYTLYHNEIYELAGDINGGIICSWQGGRLAFSFLDENGFVWSSGDIVPNYTIEGVLTDYTAYIVDSMLYNGNENVGGYNRGWFGAPYNIEYFEDNVYHIEPNTSTEKALTYTGDVLIVDGVYRNPNISGFSNELRIGIERWFDFIATSDLNYTGDPQDDQGNSTSGGGDGVPQVSIDVDFPELPPSDLLDSGIIKMYKPSKANLKALMNFIYSAPDQVITNFKKIWANPMDSIISLSLIPFDVNADGGIDNIKFCGVDTEIEAAWVKTQFVTIDCGTVMPDDMLKEEYKTLLDYSNYTKVRCYLPFISTVELNTDDVMGATLHIVYNVDLLTGECIANIKCTKSDPQYNIQYNSVIYSFKGNVLSSAPITGNNYQQLYSGIMNMVTATALPSPQAVAGVASDMLGQKVSVQRSGTITGNSGTLGDYTPYLIVEKPIRSLPENNGRYVGYPLNMTGKIKDGIKVSDNPVSYRKLSGFTQVEKDSFRCDNFTKEITDEEAQEIIQFMEGGIIV